jgi:putative FmdB family regulatory protein
MPTYEYKCEACNYTFEQFQSIKADSLKKCPQCGKNRLQRLISGGGALIFKGSGFYITDYRSESYKDSAKKESDSKPAATEGTSKTEATSGNRGNSTEAAKPAAQAETKTIKTDTKAPKSK